MNTQRNRRQFDRQAGHFSNWPVTQNVDYMTRYYEFCGVTPDDTLLDVACGTGAYAMFCAARIQHVCGVDVSGKMIDIADRAARDLELSNTWFTTHDVCDLPFQDNQFSIVNCKSAFHHFDLHPKIIREMRRCCRTHGKIAIQDIIAYDDPRVDDAMEAFERLVDSSHHRTLSKQQILQLLSDAEIEIDRTQTVDIELNLEAYIRHAVRTDSEQRKLDRFVNDGIHDDQIGSVFFQHRDDWHFKRKVIVLLGTPK